MSGNSYTHFDQGAHISRQTATAGACVGTEGNAYGCNAEQRATMAELGLSLEDAPKARRGKDEWEDALIKHKVMDAPLDHRKMDFMLKMKREDEAVMAEARRDDLADKNLDELDELLEDEDLESSVFEKYREARLAEMKAVRAKNIYSGLTHVTAQDYVKEVTQASEGTLVLLHLYQDYVPECTRLNEVMQELSMRHRSAKWCKIKSVDANADYPDSALPTLLVYKDGQVMDRMVALKTNGGEPVTADGLEWRLAAQGFVKTDLEEDPFKDLDLAKMKILRGGRGRAKGKVGYHGDSDDSDSD